MSNASNPSDNSTAGVVAPPPLIAVVTIALGLLMDWLFPLSVLSALFGWAARLVIGTILFAAGGALVYLAEHQFRGVGTNVPPWKPSLKLATSGIYQWVRNPMYVGVGLMVAGVAIALGSDWTLVLMIPAALLLHYGVVLREERYLEARFGEPYRAYKDSVPRYGWHR